MAENLHLPANLMWNLFSGFSIWTYKGQFGAKSLTAQALKMVWWSYNKVYEVVTVQYK